MKKTRIAVFLVMLSMFSMLTLTAVVPQPITAQDEDFQEWDVYGPYWDYLIGTVITVPDAQYLALKKGEVDHMLWYIPTESVDDAVDDPDIAVETSGDAGYFYLAFNFRKSPTDDLAFRKAIAHCTDKEKIVSILLEGLGIELWSVVPPLYYGEWSNPDVTTYEYDLDLARETLLNGADGIFGTADDWTYTGGTWYMPNGDACPPQVIITPSYDPVRIQSGVLIAEAAASIGLPVTTTAVEFSTLVDLAFGDTATDTKPIYDMYIMGWGLGVDPDSPYYFFHSSQDAPYGSNSPGIADAQLDQYLEDSMYLMKKEDVLTALYLAQQRIAELLPYVPLYERLCVTGARTDRWEMHVNVVGSAFGIGDQGSAFGTKINVRLKDEEGGPYGGTYVMAMLDDMKTQNPLSAYPIGTVWCAMIQEQIYESMISTNPIDPTEDIGQLAYEWSMEPYEWMVGEEGMKLTWKLRDDVIWHDGVPFTAADVKFTVEYCQENEIPELLPAIEYVYEIQTPDDYTVVMYCDKTKYWATHDLGFMTIIPKHIWEDIADPLTYANDHPIGTGPALWVNRVPGEYTLLTFNPNYYRLPEGRLAAEPELKTELYRLMAELGLDAALLQTEVALIEEITSILTAISAMQSSVDSDLASLETTISSLTNVAYVSVALAVISLLLGGYAVLKKRQ